MWITPHQVVHEDHAIKLIQFKEGKGKSILIVPPQAGHNSGIADYSKGQSLAACAVEHSQSDEGVYCIEWKPCTAARCNESYHDLIKQLHTAISIIGDGVHLVGLCQGGTLATVYAAMYDTIDKLTVAGAPIDVRAAKSDLDGAINMSMWLYRSVVANWPDMGLMSGRTMLNAWKSLNPQTHYFDRYMDPSESKETFYNWYDKEQNIAGNWYLYLIENLFKGNKLIKGEFIVDDKPISLANIKCTVNTVGGAKDTISPPAHTEALLGKLFQGGTKWTINSGHIGVFMSRQGIQEVWPDIFRGDTLC